MLSCDVIIWDDNTPFFIFPENFPHSSTKLKTSESTSGSGYYTPFSPKGQSRCTLPIGDLIPYVPYDMNRTEALVSETCTVMPGLRVRQAASAPTMDNERRRGLKGCMSAQIKRGVSFVTSFPRRLIMCGHKEDRFCSRFTLL